MKEHGWAALTSILKGVKLIKEEKQEVSSAIVNSQVYKRKETRASLYMAYHKRKQAFYGATMFGASISTPESPMQLPLTRNR